jgi:hypothetical protein
MDTHRQHVVLLLVTSVVLDCLHKEGLILHLCFVVIPVVLPAVVLAHWGLSFGWVFVCFPVGIVLGLLFYTFLDAMSTYASARHGRRNAGVGAWL